jgi:uncharacterized protein (TIGR02466 family)
MLARKYIFRIANLNRTKINPGFQVSFVDSWIVKSKEGDYNPVHVHEASLSGIVYLKVPSQVADPMTTDGKLNFLFGDYRLSNLDFLGMREVVPRVGDMYLFPSWLQHVVYPFRGAEERVSYAFNLGVSGIDLGVPTRKNKA